jgi:chromate reductase
MSVNMFHMKGPVKLLAISGSVRTNSSNMTILKYLANEFPADVSCNFYTGLESLPHFNPDRDNHETIDTVNEFRRLLRESDGVIICTPEYAFGVPGTLKNALDWTVSTDIFSNKPVAIITASSLGDKAHASLLLTFKALSATIAKDASLLIPYVKTKVNTNGEVSDYPTREALKQVAQALLQSIKDRI